MLFVIAYSFTPDARDDVQERFRKTGGQPGSGVTMHGRWHVVGGGRGFVVAESTDSVAMAKWLQEWTDAIEFEVNPVNTDENVMKVIGG